MFDADLPTVETRWYQEEAVDRLFDYFATHTGKANPIIALPTGTGKSVVIAKFIKRVFDLYPKTVILKATHVKELIKQNKDKLLQIWPAAPVGIYSAGLNRRELYMPILFGGVQSLVKVAAEIGHVDLLIIDEVHLVGNDGSYLKLIVELLKINPFLKVIGLSATVYRLGMGLLTNGPIFTDIIFDLTNIDGFNRLIAEGYLATLIPKKTYTELDVSGVGISNGDYAQKDLEDKVNNQQVTYQALQELCYYGQTRNSWLVFGSGINHANNICDMLNDHFGISACVIHSKRTQTENTDALASWKSGAIRCAVNVNGLTTGIDHPPLDLIGMLRPTMSTGLWVQMLGRGTRPFPKKANCLVLDFAGNTRRLGPINDPVIPREKMKGPPGDAPIRICEVCGVYNHARATHCIACGAQFPTETKIEDTASTAPLLASDLPETENFYVQHVVYSKHISAKTGSVSLKASYFCEKYKTFYEWIFFEGKGWPLKRAREWFRQRFGEPWDGMTTDEVLTMSSKFRPPAAIRVWINKRPYPEILGVEF